MNTPLPIPLPLCFVLAATLALSACTNHEEPRQDVDFAGTYTLVSVDGASVPATVTHDDASLEVRSGTFTLTAYGTCSTQTTFVPPSGTEVTREVSATYTKDGATLTMQWEGAVTTIGTIRDTTFTMNNEGLEFVYERK